jgi:hypothetical protein
MTTTSSSTTTNWVTITPGAITTSNLSGFTIANGGTIYYSYPYDPIPERYGTYDRIVSNEPPPLLPATPEDLERLERRRIEREVEAEARRTRRAQAVDRSAELLLVILSAEQRMRYEAERVFEVIGSHGGRYRIRPGSMANVDALDPVTGEVTGRLCAHPQIWDGHGSLPDPDIALGQLLHLTTDEPGFCRLANVHGGRRPEVAALAA